jgi:hypothetical protein
MVQLAINLSYCINHKVSRGTSICSQLFDWHYNGNQNILFFIIIIQSPV